MPHNLTDVDTFTSSVTVPDGGDDRTALSVEIPFQSLANRTRNNKNRLDGLGVTGALFATHADGVQARGGDVRAFGEFTHCNASGVALSKTRVVMLPLSNAGPTSGWGTAGGGLLATLANAPVEIPIVPLRTGARVMQVKVAYLNASAPATPPGFQVIRKVADKATPGIGVQNTERSDTDGVAGTTSATPQTMSTNPFTSSIADLQNEEWFIRVQGRQVGDVIYWVEVMISDPGPRNF